MHFNNAQALWLLAFVPVLALGTLWLAFLRNKSILRGHGDPKLIGRFIEGISLRRLAAKVLALSLALSLLALSLARPVQESGKTEFPMGTINVVAVMDVSRSMAVPDYAGKLPAPFAEGRRLDMARYLISTQILPTLSYNRLGIVTFAGAAFPQAFVTDDMPPLDWVVKHAIEVGSAPGEGSELGKAFDLAFEILDLDAKPAHRNIIVLFSDGGNDTSAEDMALIIRELKKRDIDLIVVGLGKTTQSPIPTRLLSEQDRYSNSNKQFYEVNGEVVTSRLDENVLLLLKNAVNGRYVRVVNASDFQMTSMVSRMETIYKPGQYEFFPWLLIGSFFFLVLSVAIAHRPLDASDSLINKPEAERKKGAAKGGRP